MPACAVILEFDGAELAVFLTSRQSDHGPDITVAEWSGWAVLLAPVETGWEMLRQCQPSTEDLGLAGARADAAERHRRRVLPVPVSPSSIALHCRSRNDPTALSRTRLWLIGVPGKSNSR